MSKKVLVLSFLFGVLFSFGFFSYSIVNKINVLEAGSCLNGCCSGCSQCTTFKFTSPCDYFCYNATSCAGGGTTCGSCPAAPPPAPPPGSPPGTPAPPPAPPSCAATTPSAAPVQVTPLDGAKGLSNAILFDWNPIANNQWGVGCPQANSYYIYYAQTVDGGGIATCPGLSYSYAYRGAATDASLNLNWGKTYCWRVGAYNGTNSRLSGFRTLTVDAPPTLTSSGFTSIDVCGNGKSGAAGQNGVTNPVTYSLTYTDPDSNDTFKEIWLAFLIQTYTAANYTELQVHPAAHTYKTVAMKIDLATKRAYTINAAGTWDAGSLTGDLSNADGSATLMDIGTSTVGSIAGNTATATFKIRFENNFPTNALTIHAAALMQAPSGTLFTSGGTGAAPRRYSRIPGTWQVDVKKPSATLSGPTYQANGSFNVTWSASDAVGLTNVYSYIYSDVDGSQLKNNTNNIVTTTPGVAIGYPNDTPNAGITTANLGVKNYSDLTPSNFANYTFSIYAKDAACNVTNSNTSSTTPSPWLTGTGGDISGIGGIDRTRIPTINNFTLPPYITTTSPAFFSNYGAISGTGTNAKGVISKLNQAVQDYIDDAIDSPSSNTGLWYDYLLDKVKKNGKTNVTNLAPTTISGNMSSALLAGANTQVAVEVTGDLTINSNTACNVRALVFVRQNLIINPDLTITAAPNATPITSQLYNGCMFIVKGDVTIGTGTTKTSPARASNSAVLAGYDVVNAFIITDGVFSVPADMAAVATNKGDGLYINGGVVARNTMSGTSTTLKRNINFTGNNLQPSMLINYDPRYKLSFSEDFATREYSIREFGL